MAKILKLPLYFGMIKTFILSDDLKPKGPEIVNKYISKWFLATSRWWFFGSCLKKICTWTRQIGSFCRDPGEREKMFETTT